MKVNNNTNGILIVSFRLVLPTVVWNIHPPPPPTHTHAPPPTPTHTNKQRKYIHVLASDIGDKCSDIRTMSCKQHFYACEKFMQICQNRSLDKFMRLIYAF